MFKLSDKNYLVLFKQAYFKREDSFINQLIPITHEQMYESLNAGLEVRSAFLDISKVEKTLKF